jgi:hypothetical protein
MIHQRFVTVSDSILCNRSSDGRVHYQVPSIIYVYNYCNNVLAPHLLVTVPGKRESVYCTEIRRKGSATGSGRYYRKYETMFGSG